MSEFEPSRRRLWTLRAIKTVTLVAVVLVWQGVVRRPTGMAQGTSLHEVDSPRVPIDDGILRVATFNMAGGVGEPDNRFDLDRSAAQVDGIDVVGIEEMHGGGILHLPDQGQILGEKLHLSWLFAPSERRWGNDDFGNGLLSAWPVTAWERLPLSTRLDSSNRSLLRATLQWHDHPITVLVTHLDRGDDHDVELGAVLATFRDTPGTVLLLADLNTIAAHPLLAAFRQQPGLTDVLSPALHPEVLPSNVDWIFARGLKCIASGQKTNGASDHLIVWANFTLSD